MNDRLSRLKVGTCLTLIIILSILTQGYHVGPINHGFQLALIRRFAGETAFENDAFLTAMTRTYTTAFFPAVGLLARYVNLELLLFLLFVVFRAGSVWLAFNLGKTVFGDVRTGIVTAAITSVHVLTFAMDIVSDNYLTHGALAQVMTLAALLLLAKGRPVLAFALAGALFNFHAMHATHLVAVMGVALLLGSDRRRALQPILISVPVVVILCLPTIYWMWRESVLGAPVPPGYIDAIRGWFPTHFWPTTWSVTDWISFLFPALAVWPLWVIAKSPRDGGITGRVATVALAGAVLGGIVTELLPSPFVIRLHPMRLSWLMTLAGAPYLANASLELLRARGSTRFARFGFVLGSLLLLVAAMPMAYRYDYAIVLIPACYGVAFEIKRHGDLESGADRIGRGATPMIAASLAVAIAVPAILTMVSMRAFGIKLELASPAFRFLLIEGSVGVFAVLSLALTWVRRNEGPNPARARVRFLRGVGAVAAIHLALNGLVMAEMGGRGALKRWRDVQEWCRDHLERGEPLLVPLTQIGLRAFSNQTPAVDFQEGDVIFHQPEYLETFLGKLRLYGWKPGRLVGFEFISKLDALEEALSKEQLAEVGRKLGARTAVRRSREPPLDLPILFSNDEFVVYRLDGAAPAR